MRQSRNLYLVPSLSFCIEAFSFGRVAAVCAADSTGFPIDFVGLFFAFRNQHDGSQPLSVEASRERGTSWCAFDYPASDQYGPSSRRDTAWEQFVERRLRHISGRYCLRALWS